MASLPRRRTLELALQSPAQWVIKDLQAEARVSICVTRSNYSSTNGSLHLASSVAGAVSLRTSNSEMPVTAADDCSARVTHAEGGLVIGESGLGRTILELAGGSLGGGSFPETVLVGDAAITPVNNQAVAIEALVVDGERTLELPANNVPVQISTLKPSAERGSLLARTEQRQRGSGTPVAIQSVERLTLEAALD